MQPSKPTIIIVPGAWQRVTAFQSFVNSLRNEGYPTEAVELPSVGCASDSTPPGLADDVASVRKAVIEAIDNSQDVILLCHSYGGLVGSNAVVGLDIQTRSRGGKAGGIKKIIYLSAFVVPCGKSLFDLLGGQPATWMEAQCDKISAKEEFIREIGFNDLPLEKAAEACQQMTHSSASVFVTPSAYEPWANGISCAYILSTEDNAVPHPLQKLMAQQLGPTAKSVTLKSGHCSFLSVPEQLLEAVASLSNA